MKKYILIFCLLSSLAFAQTAPDPGRVPINKTVTLTVTADGTQPFNYQWYKDNQTLANETKVDLVFSSFNETNGGLYHCVVSNEAGSTTSNKVQLTPVKAPSKSTITVNIAVGVVNP